MADEAALLGLELQSALLLFIVCCRSRLSKHVPYAVLCCCLGRRVFLFCAGLLLSYGPYAHFISALRFIYLCTVVVCVILPCKASARNELDAVVKTVTLSVVTKHVHVYN